MRKKSKTIKLNQDQVELLHKLIAYEYSRYAALNDSKLSSEKQNIKKLLSQVSALS